MTIHSERTKFSKWLAPGLLFILVAVLIGTFLLDSSLLWVRIIQSSAEAGVIGGLVDWFAVVAIFRHPAGIPIPHTAVIRRSKDRIADGIYHFITSNFSDQNKASQWIEGRRPSKHLSEWLTQPRNAEFAAHVVLNSIPSLLTPKSDYRIRSFVTKTIVEELRKQNISPLLGRFLFQIYRRNHHQDIVDALIRLSKEYIEENRGLINERVSKNTGWLMPKFIDRWIADDVEQSLLDKLEEVSDRNHEFRLGIDSWMKRLIEDLERKRFDARTVRYMWEKFEKFTKSEEARQAIEGIWNDIKNELLDDSGVNRTRLRRKLADLLQRVGRQLSEDLELQREIDARLSDLTELIAPDVADGAGKYIRDQIRGWSAEQVSKKLESAVGKELQYIRINGTILGCFVGFLLFWIIEAAS